MNFKTYDSYDLGHKDRAKPVEINWICDVINFAKEPYRKIHAVAVVGNVQTTTACHDFCEIAAQEPFFSFQNLKKKGILLRMTKRNKSYLRYIKFSMSERQFNVR